MRNFMILQIVLVVLAVGLVAAGTFVYRRWRDTCLALDLTLVAVMALLPDAVCEPQDRGLVRIRRGGRAIEIDLFDAMRALADRGIQGVGVHVGVTLFRETSEEYRAAIEAFVLDTLRELHTDATVVEDDGRALTVRAAGNSFELVRLPLLLEFWGRDDEPRSERTALARQILAARVASNDAAPERERVLPRFLTPNRALRTMGTAGTQRGIQGLRWPVDCVIDFGATCLSVPADSRAHMGVKSVAELHALAHANLRARTPAPGRGNRGLVVIDDAADHAAVQVLLLPERLIDGEAWLAASPTPAKLLLWREGDHVAARKAEQAMKTLDPTCAPIPAPVRVTPEGFAESSWAEALAVRSKAAVGAPATA